MNFTMALPIAVMLASIMTFGNMGEHFELTAAKSSGISLYKIMAPIFFLAVAFTIGSFLFANNIFPYATLKAYSLISSIRQQHPSLRIQEGIFNYDVEGYVIRVGRKDRNSQMMYDFLIYDHVNYQGNKSVVSADSGTVNITEDLKHMIITLYDGMQYEEIKENVSDQEDNPRKYPYHIDEFKKQVVIIPLKGFDYQETDMSLYQQHYNILNLSQLNKKIDSLENTYQKKVDYYLRIMTHNDLLKYQIKLRTTSDTNKYADKIQKLNNIPPNQLNVFYDLDSAFSSKTLNQQKQILRTANTNAENLYNRINVFYQEFQSRREWLAEHKIAKNKKYVFAIACFIFFFIGAPLGSIIRKGGFGLPTIISVLLVLVFYVILTLGEKMARDGVVSPALGVWLPVFIFMPFEIFLFYKASTDSVVLNYDYYREIFSKFFKKITPAFIKRRQVRLLRRRKRRNKRYLKKKQRQQKKKQNKTK